MSSIGVTASETEPILSITDLSKAFAGVPALVNARLQVARGEIHALIGENGAGKSTLIKILTGALSRDAGMVRFGGQDVRFQSPGQAQDAGIATIYQEINLIPFRSVAENMFLGREPRRFGLIDWRRMNAEAAELLAGFGIKIDVTQPLLNLNIALRQMVAIARAVSQQSKLVVMDEPTSSLDEGEVATLFRVLRGLRDQNVSVIFVSHKLDELFALCDRVTVMRDGQTVAERSLREMTKLELVAAMLGRELGEVQSRGQTSFGPATDRSAGNTLLQASDIRRGQALRGASVTIHAGEVVGLAGLLGSGRTEVARAIFGADMLQSGSVKIDGEAVTFRAPSDAIRAGLGFCSEDRKSEGIIPSLSVRENMTLAALPGLSRYGIVSRRRQQEIVERFIARLGIKTAGPEQKIRELSGGNQQKVLLARWLCLNPKLLILDEPTRGIDVGAKGEIQSLVNEFARDGMGVMMISSEVEELVEGSDRVVVMRDGRSVADLPQAEVTQDVLLAAMAQGELVVPDLSSQSEAARA